MEKIGSVAFALLDVVGISVLSCIFAFLFWKLRANCSEASRIQEDADESPLKKFLMAAFQDIHLIAPASPGIFPFGWDEFLARILRTALAKKAIPEEEVLNQLGERLKIAGRRCFEQHRDYRVHPDRVTHPAALAFAIQCGELTPEEVASIRFDDDQTPETFIKECGDPNLVEKTFQSLLPHESE